MKTITKEIKARVLNQYAGTDVMFHTGNGSSWKLTYSTIAHLIDMKADYFTNPFIELKPLSKISDEYAIEVAKIQIKKWDHDCDEVFIENKTQTNFSFYTKYKGEFYQNYFLCYNDIDLACYQYLQSRGYALPYMEYSVDDLVELGVYKLI